MKVSSEQAPRYQPWSKHSRVWTGKDEASVGESDPQRLKTTRAGPSGSVKAREHEDRELPAGLVLILDKNRHLGGLTVEQALALLPRGYGGLDPKALAAHFDRCLRVRE